MASKKNSKIDWFSAVCYLALIVGFLAFNLHGAWKAGWLDDQPNKVQVVK